MHITNNDNIFEFFDRCEPDGTYTFQVLEQDLPPAKTAAEKLERLRNLVESEFYTQPLFTLNLTRLKKWITDIETTSELDEEGNLWVTLNLAKFFMLPGDAPKAEVEELRKFFEATKPLFEDQPSLIAHIQICNNWDKNKRVYGTLTCGVRSDEKIATVVDVAAHTARLNALIEQSAVLQAFLRNCALSLQRLGPWSWFSIAEEHIFGTGEGPWHRWFRDNYERERAQKQALNAR